VKIPLFTPRRIRICPIVPNSTNASSFYRAYGPFGDLHRKGKIELLLAHEFDWSLCKLVDVFFLQRPHDEQAAGLVDLAKKNGVKVWIDWDDDFMSIPISNPAFGTYADPKNQARMLGIIERADLVTVSTQVLKEVFRARGITSRIEVVPNALDDRICGDRSWDEPAGPRNDLVIWRGSNTHVADIEEHADAIMDAVEKNPKTQFLFWGFTPWSLAKRVDPAVQKNIRFAEACDVVEYLRRLKAFRPRAVIVPLQDNAFNRAKSNIAWIEATYAGALTVGPNWPEWPTVGSVYYGKLNDGDRTAPCFAFAANLAANSSIDSRTAGEMNGAAWEHIQKTLTLSMVNRRRADLMREIAG
jgi:hypothetical protein